jgi:hypothetical protein
MNHQAWLIGLYIVVGQLKENIETIEQKIYESRDEIHDEARGLYLRYGLFRKKVRELGLDKDRKSNLGCFAKRNIHGISMGWVSYSFPRGADGKPIINKSTGKQLRTSNYIKRDGKFHYSTKVLKKHAQEWELSEVLRIEESFSILRQQLDQLRKIAIQCDTFRRVSGYEKRKKHLETDDSFSGQISEIDSESLMEGMA